jgi:4-amino-4-deoxy-L-arabinose transferase-like glycosyltransferase
MSAFRSFFLLFALAITAALLLRPLIPPDETRYLQVAHEMWETGEFLVPHIHGQTYSHKPPLMFWIWHAGWWFTGPNVLWPRISQCLAAALSLFLLHRVARRLKPAVPEFANTVVVVWASTVTFQLYSSLMLFDVWMSTGVFTAWWGLLIALPPHQEQSSRAGLGWTLYALGAGVALLFKGPAALVTLLPPLVALPLWLPRERRVQGTWWRGTLAVGCGLGCVLAWALPAAAAGGEAYSNAILWGQSAGRVMGEAAPHARPFWWFLALLPAFMAPWSLWPPLWQRRSIATLRNDPAFGFGIVSFVVPLALFSAISGKQPHYLVPALPGAALMFAVCCFGTSAPRSWFAGFLLLGAVIAVAVPFSPVGPMAASPHAAYVAAGFLAALAVASFMARRAAPRIGLLEAAAFGPLLLMALHLATAPTFAANYNLEPAGAYFKAATEKGRPAAIYGSTYHGQVHFLADIHAPFANPQTEAELRTWLDEHPQGVVGVVLKPAQPTRLAEMATNIVPFGNRRLALFDASALSPLLASTPR